MLLPEHTSLHLNGRAFGARPFWCIGTQVTSQPGSKYQGSNL